VSRAFESVARGGGWAEVCMCIYACFAYGFLLGSRSCYCHWVSIWFDMRALLVLSVGYRHRVPQALSSSSSFCSHVLIWVVLLSAVIVASHIHAHPPHTSISPLRRIASHHALILHPLHSMSMSTQISMSLTRLVVRSLASGASGSVLLVSSRLLPFALMAHNKK